MKQLLKIMALISILIFFAGKSFAVTPSPPHGSVTFQVFYDELSPYGSWVTYSSYGYVWIPYGGGFVPYNTNGHWVYTDLGWTWASGYSWGWAPFHYGRWLYDDFYGWIWVAGYEWAPSWVVWGSYDYYYGWAPIAPGITVVAAYRPPPHHWLFCPSHLITSVQVHRHVVTHGIPRERVTVINNYNSQSRYHYGPRKEAVEKASGKPVTRVAVVERNSPAPAKVTGSRMEVYRPEITKGKAAPSKLKTLEEVKVEIKGRQNDDVYERGEKKLLIPSGEREGNTINEKKPAVQERSNKEKITPQQKANPPVRERSGNSSQEKSPDIQKRDIITPQPKTNTPPVQQRKQPPQHQPSQKKQKVTPR